MPSAPLVIYLDTQDYINIFNEDVGGPFHQTLSQLFEYRDRNQIAIGYSFVTMLEFITRPDSANRNERVRRGNLVKLICGKNAFPTIPDLERVAVIAIQDSLKA